MSKFTVSSILFVIILLIMILLVQRLDYPGWILIFPILIYLILLIIGSAKIGWNFYFRSFNGIQTDKKIVAITFDDGPDPNNTPELLDLLQLDQVTAAFFCLGEKVEQYPEIIGKIDNMGHLVGNHSYTHHRWFDLFTSDRMTQELNKTNAEIEKVIGKIPRLFRPPYGVTNPNLQKAVHKSEMISVGWTLRSFDTVRSKEQVLHKLKNRTRPGTVVLFHDTTEDIIPLVREYLGWLKTRGFKVVSLEQMFNIEAYVAD